MQETIEKPAGGGAENEQTLSGRPIRALFVIPSSPNRSIQLMIFAHREVAALRHAGVVCETFHFSSTRSLVSLSKEWWDLRRMVRAFRPDVVHAQYGTLTALFSAVGTLAPLVVTYRGSDLNPDPSVHCVFWSLRRLLSEIAALRASRIICVSEELRQRLWWRKHDAIVIPTGVDIDTFYPRPQSAARAQLGWKNSERVILFNAGPNAAIKRLDLAQGAVEAAQRACGKIRFVVLRGEVAPGTVSVMMSAADCLLLTSDWEGSPTVVQEAMACGLPVVTVDVGDVKQQLTGVWPSRIVRRDAETIGLAAAEILKLGQRSNGCSRVRDLSHAALANRIISIYRSAI